MPKRPKTDERELGNGQTTANGWDGILDQAETAPELQWPNSVAVYRRMTTDSQIGGLLQAVTLPIRGYQWSVQPGLAKMSVARRVADNLGLPMFGEKPKPRARLKGRFSWDDHLRHALLALTYGHMIFEQVYAIDDDGLARIHKWAPRMPASISRWKLARDGNVEAVYQYNTAGNPWPNSITQWGDIELPVERLMIYSHDREGNQWHGKSALRDIYRPWLIKDKLIRVDAIKHERNGMGTPVVEAPPGASGSQIDRLSVMAQKMKAGESSGAAVPSGSKVSFKGVEGSVPDTLASIQYHDQQMAKRFLAMFFELGQSRFGSRALGDSFVDFFDMSLRTIAQEVADIANAHGVEDLIDLNYGPDEPAPQIVFEAIDDPTLSVLDLTNLIDKNAITVDTETEAWIRERHDLPALKGPRPEPAAPPPAANPDPNATQPPAPVPTAKPVAVAASAGHRQDCSCRSCVVMASDLGHREMTAVEMASMVDFDALNRIWAAKTAQAVAVVEATRPSQVDEILAAIRTALEAGDIQALADITVASNGSADLAAITAATVAASAVEARLEAVRQGQEVVMPDLAATVAEMGERAAVVSTQLTRGLVDAAVREAMIHMGPGVSIDSVIEAVKAHLDGLSTVFVEDNVGALTTAAQNQGRLAVFEEAQPSRMYASELLDRATCSACSAKDGTEYASANDARGDYPSGGYRECLGGGRCRGTLVAVYDEAPATLQ